MELKPASIGCKTERLHINSILISPALFYRCKCLIQGHILMGLKGHSFQTWELYVGEVSLKMSRDEDERHGV